MVVLLPLLAGCQYDAYKEEAVNRAASVSDDIMDRTYVTFCSRRFSLRAYTDWMARNGKDWSDLEQWCDWSSVPPTPEPLDDGQ